MNDLSRNLCEELECVVAELLTGPSKTIVVHSSFMDLLPPPAFTPKDAVNAFSNLASEGWTFAFASFTFSFCAGKPFHAAESRSETGLLADWVLKEAPGALRMRHPIYSYVVIGPGAAEVVASCSHITAFGEAGPFGYFEKIDALQLGLGTFYFAQMHRYEETEQVRYRYYKNFAGPADWNDGKGPRAITTQMYVRDLETNPQVWPNPVIDLLQEQKKMRSIPLWRNFVHSISTSAMADTTKSLLRRDPLGLLTPDTTERVRDRFYAT